MSAIAEPGDALAGAAPVASATQKGWSPPLSLPRLYLLLVATFGLYSLVLMYRTARDLCDHTGAKLRPALYPFSLLIAVVAPFAIGSLTRHTNRALRERGQPPGVSAWTVGVLLLLGYLLSALSSRLQWSFSIVPVLLIAPLPWLLLQRMSNRLKTADGHALFRARPNRYSGWQIAAMAAGGIVWSLIAVGSYQDFARIQGSALVVGAYRTDPEQRYAFRASAPGWTQVRPGILINDAAVELLGPGVSDWAVLRIDPVAGLTLDDAVSFRYDEIVGAGSGAFYEQRRLLSGTETAVSYVTYQGRGVIDGPFTYHVTTLIADGELVEFIVYTAGSTRHRAEGEALAFSLLPHSMVVE